jgi:hypothetical protein
MSGQQERSRSAEAPPGLAQAKAVAPAATRYLGLSFNAKDLSRCTLTWFQVVALAA